MRCVCARVGRACRNCVPLKHSCCENTLLRGANSQPSSVTSAPISATTSSHTSAFRACPPDSSRVQVCTSSSSSSPSSSSPSSSPLCDVAGWAPVQSAGRLTSLNIERVDSAVLGAVSASGLQCSEIAPASVVLSSTPPSSSNSRTLMSNNNSSCYGEASSPQVQAGADKTASYDVSRAASDSTSLLSSVYEKVINHNNNGEETLMRVRTDQISLDSTVWTLTDAQSAV